MSDANGDDRQEMEAFYARRRKKNWVFLVILSGLAVLFFAITILKMS